MQVFNQSANKEKTGGKVSAFSDGKKIHSLFSLFGFPTVGCLCTLLEPGTKGLFLGTTNSATRANLVTDLDRIVHQHCQHVQTNIGRIGTA